VIPLPLRLAAPPSPGGVRHVGTCRVPRHAKAKTKEKQDALSKEAQRATAGIAHPRRNYRQDSKLALHDPYGREHREKEER
jgi:hypothetical protein